jgi:hypothetical protein
MHTMRIHYRPDQYPDWTLWREFIQKFDMIGKPGAIAESGVPTARAGFAPRTPLGKPQNDCDPTTGRNLRRGFDFQVKFSGTGHVMIDRFRLHGQKLTERSTSKC